MATQSEVNEAYLDAQLALLKSISSHISGQNMIKSSYVLNMANAYRAIAGGDQPGQSSPAAK